MQVGASVGAAIDYTIATQDVAYFFAVVATEHRVLDVHILARELPISADSLRHIESLRDAVEKSIIYHSERNGATLQ